ncbi:MAG: GAF domain-containing protein [Chloroflexota bacterium]
MGGALLLFSTLRYPIDRWEGLVLVIFVPWMAMWPVSVGVVELSLIHVLALSGGLLFGPTVVAWTVAAGVLFGYLSRRLAWRFFAQPLLPRPNHYLDAGFVFGAQVIPLVLGFSITGWTGYDGFSPLWPAVLKPLLLFSLIQFAIYLGFIFAADLKSAERRRAMLELFLVEAIPLPFVWIAPMTYFTAQWGVLILLGGVPLALGGLFYGMNVTRFKLERRVQELSTIENISRVLRSTLELEALLSVIHQQVTQILQVGNFYVALYDAKDGLLKYPLAVKSGERCHWSPRSLEPERLTDRVIQEGVPILITPRNHDALAQAGLPASSERTEAWAGVPLITSERTIGCLAVFGTSTSSAQFTHSDLELLNILSGQVSVAIENALLYEQAQRRASQLEALNRIMALITASLDTQEVLAQVCIAVIELVGGQHSAVYLLDQEQGRCWLAHGENISASFVEKNNTSTAIQENRIRYVYSDQPVVISNISQSTLPVEYLDLLFAEGIHALADFPLATPDGRIGILAVYYDVPHAFAPEEIDLVQALAYQAALAASNARIYAVADKALARRADQLAILENVGRELGAAINSPRLFEMILDYALRFTNSPWGDLTLYDPFTNTLEVKASRGYRQIQTHYPVEKTLSGQALLTRKPVRVGNTSDVKNHVDLTDGEARSQLSIPIIHEERVLGVITLESDHADAYSENDQTFIAQLATQAAIAVVNAELYVEIQRRLREQTTLYQVGARLVASPELDGVMHAAVQAMEGALPGAVVGAYLWDEGRAVYEVKVTSDLVEFSLPAFIPEIELVAVRTALSNTAWIRVTPGKQSVPILLASCAERQMLIFPLVVKRQRLGMLVICVAEPGPQEEDLQLLHGIASQIAISLQNSLLLQRVMHGRDQLAAVLNSVSDGLMMFDRSGRVLLVNQAIQNLMGLERAALIGTFVAALPVTSLRMLGYTPYEVESLAKSIEQGHPLAVSKSVFHISEPKPERIIERLVQPVLAQEGNPIGWMMVLRDITEETQVTQARELITETLVHDLRSPVSAVLSAVDILENTLMEEQKKDELVAQALRVAYNSANRVLSLIESLLDIAKLKAGRMELYMTEFEPAVLVTGILGDFMPQANEMGVILRHELAPHSSKVRADQGKITRVLTNLLDNALKFTPAGGQVLVSVEQHSPEFVAIHVCDTGPGIPEEYREKVFDRFTQIPGQKGRRRGSGLGLTFCRLAVEAHGGRIWVSPRAGGGSDFTFLLPAL